MCIIYLLLCNYWHQCYKEEHIHVVHFQSSRETCVFKVLQCMCWSGLSSVFHSGYRGDYRRLRRKKCPSAMRLYRQNHVRRFSLAIWRHSGACNQPDQHRWRIQGQSQNICGWYREQQQLLSSPDQHHRKWQGNIQMLLRYRRTVQALFRKAQRVL